MERSNLFFYKELSTPPENALKIIQAGRMKGKTDINPQWRYERMTESFGVCGIGWKFKKVNTEFVKGAGDEMAVFVDIELFIKIEDEWSDPIPGNGGEIFVVNEKNGIRTNDEAVKMATTDALGTAMKMLGMAADVYRGFNDTKYNNIEAESKSQSTQYQNQNDERPWMTEKQFESAKQRISGGEKELLPKLIAEFKMKKIFKTELENLIK
jgi:hypothetical protein